MKGWAAGLVSALLVTLALSASAPAAASASPDPFGEHTPLMVVLDTSDSMNDEIGGALGQGGRRIDSAQSALLDLVAALGADQPYGMIAYPGRDAPQIDGCATGRIETPLAALDPAQASAQIRRMTPDGDTPTGPALRRASQAIADRYGENATGVIVLVSDGESNCGTPPCEVAASIRASGIDVQVNTVGLEVDGAGEDELRCIADATGGRYVGADDEEGLVDAVTGAALGRLSISVDAPDSFAVVSGTGDASGGTVRVSVRSTGRVAAADVRVTLSVALDGETAGSVLVTRPVRFLGNLDVESERQLSFDVRPDDSLLGAATWTVSATSRNARPQITTGSASVTDHLGASALGPLFDGVDRVAVVGDSYSSGEGAGGYLPGTDGDDDGESMCHRSDSQYAAEIWGIDHVDLIACSGAVTSDFFHPQRSGGSDVPAQLTVLREAALSDTPPDAVLLSIGGNDAGFADIAKRCIYGAGGSLIGLPLGWRCDAGIELDGNGFAFNETTALERAMAVQNDIENVLRQVDNAVNDDEARRNRGGAVAPIVILPYPRILPDTAAGQAAPSGCFVGIGGEEVGFLNRFFDALNTSVELAGYTVRGEGRPVYVVPDVVDAFQPDHTICEGGDQSYAVFDSVDKVKTLHISALLGQNGLLHPNRDGHAAMARAITAWSNSPASRAATVTVEPSWDAAVVPAEVSWWEATITGLLDPSNSHTSAGGSVRVERDGYLPGQPVVIRFDSTPTVLGTAIADDDGRVSVFARVPSDAPVGEHHVVVFGFDAEGTPVARSQAIEVLPAGGPWLMPAVIGGAVLVVLGSIGLVVVRRPRRGRPGGAA
jgi:lysophospholipase L1-like esterase